MRARARFAVLSAAAALILMACGTGEGSDGSSSASGGAASSEQGTVTVYAAASLTDSFDRLVEEFESRHPGTDVMVDYGGSTGLAQRLQEGARADVFASADERIMDRLTGSDLPTGEPETFASNTLTLVVPDGNPAGISGLNDLGKEGVNFVRCSPEVPCGAAADELEELNGVELNPVSSEHSVTDVLGKVTSGQADAGLVYATDAQAAGERVEKIEVPHAEDVVNRYPVVKFPGSSNEAAAGDFVDLLMSERGQDILRDEGFGAP